MLTGPAGDHHLLIEAEMWALFGAMFKSEIKVSGQNSAAAPLSPSSHHSKQQQVTMLWRNWTSIKPDKDLIGLHFSPVTLQWAAPSAPAGCLSAPEHLLGYKNK